MKTRNALATLLMLLVPVLIGCGEKHSHAPTTPDADHGHDHKAAPHGGELVALAGGTVNIEFLHDESAGTLTIHVLDGTMHAVAVAEAPVLNLKAASGPKQLTGVAKALTASGASEWSFQDEALKHHPDGVSLRITIAGKTYSPEMPHEHH